MRALPLFVLLSACAPSYDLELVLDSDTVAVGEEATVTMRGLIDAPANASAYLSVAIESAGGDLDTPDVVFETLKATPSGQADFLDGRHSAVNESAPILFSLHDGAEDITAKWRFVCGTPGEWSVFGSIRLQHANGAPLSSGEGNLRATPLTCE